MIRLQVQDAKTGEWGTLNTRYASDKGVAELRKIRNGWQNHWQFETSVFRIVDDRGRRVDDGLDNQSVPIR